METSEPYVPNNIMRGIYNRYTLLGLPVDNVTMQDVKNILRSDICEEKPLIFSTININWVAESCRDFDFRESILNSDLVVIDGRPLLWIAKFLKYPFVETVPGSTLIEELKYEFSSKPVKIFLLGGDEGVAEKARSEVNKVRSGIKIVGAINPGFGSIEEMSSDELINEINAVEPDLLLVALGAKKGMAWIVKNKARLQKVRVVSHLGATINFLAGTIRRAPKWMQNSGLEWFWRIIQEPHLYRRYLLDSFLVIKILLRNKK